MPLCISEMSLIWIRGVGEEVPEGTTVTLTINTEEASGEWVCQSNLVPPSGVDPDAIGYVTLTLSQAGYEDKVVYEGPNPWAGGEDYSGENITGQPESDSGRDYSGTGGWNCIYLRGGIRSRIRKFYDRQDCKRGLPDSTTFTWQDPASMNVRQKEYSEKRAGSPWWGTRWRSRFWTRRTWRGNLVEILPRKNELFRPAVANIDQALVLFALESPQT